MAVVLDSDAVVGFLDRSDALHAAADSAIRELIREHRLLVSAVTYAEVLTGSRLGHHDEERVRGFFLQLVSEVLPVNMSVAERAADLRSRLKSLRMPDALILATADIEPEVDLILTGDKKAARISDLGCEVRLL
ncbi:MAG TPA: PIN domain-containing protein [Solirubrobacterales bacterium]|nr:PIN domain-containing protein [Solirubrobacterales bacterium]